LFIDIHSHILPGIDDGARDEDTAIKMLRVADANRTGHIFATPHYIPGHTSYTPAYIAEKCVELQRYAESEGLNIKILPGCEVFISPDLPDLYKKGKLLTLNNSSYMLIELPMLSIPSYTDTVLFNLQVNGIKPIIAHPERNSVIRRNPDILRDMAGRGILAQVNAGSIVGMYGKQVEKAALKLIGAGLIHFVASDAHSERKRSPILNKTIDIIEKEYGSEIANTLFVKNGMAVINNADITVIEPIRNENAFKKALRKAVSCIRRKKGEV
jgi:protein-tyrosine phosphatase